MSNESMSLELSSAQQEVKEEKQVRVISFEESVRGDILTIENKILTDAHVKQLVAFLIAQRPKITVANLQNNAISDEGAQRIAAFLETDESLHTLDLSNNAIADSGVAALVDALTHNRHLHTLTVSNNPISDINRWQRLISALTTGNAEQNNAQLANNTPVVTSNTNRQLANLLSAPGVSDTFSESAFLTAEDLDNVRATNRHHTAYYEHAFFLTLLREQIGPNLSVLITSDETPRQAYLRHKAIVGSLQPLHATTPEELAWNLSTYPHYYAHHSITQADFDRHIKSPYTLYNFTVTYLNCADRLLQYAVTDKNVFTNLCNQNSKFYRFMELFPAYADQAVKHVFTSDLLFIQVTSSCNNLADFTRHFPKHSERTMKRVFTNERTFSAIVWHLDDLIAFTNHFPMHADQAMAVVLANDVPFNRVIGSFTGLLDIVRRFPDYADQIMKSVFRREVRFMNVGEGLLSLSFFDHFPASVDRIIEIVITSNAFYRKINNQVCNLDKFHELFGHSGHYANRAKEAKERVLAKDALFRELVDSPANLRKFVGFFPENQVIRKVIGKLLTDMEEFKRLIPDLAAFEAICHPSFDTSVLIARSTLYDNEAGRWVTNNDALFAHLIKNIDCLKRFADLFPIQAIAAANQICTKSENFARVIPDEAALKAFKASFKTVAVQVDEAHRTFGFQNSSSVLEEKHAPQSNDGGSAVRRVNTPSSGGGSFFTLPPVSGNNASQNAHPQIPGEDKHDSLKDSPKQCVVS